MERKEGEKKIKELELQKKYIQGEIDRLMIDNVENNLPFELKACLITIRMKRGRISNAKKNYGLSNRTVKSSASLLMKIAEFKKCAMTLKIDEGLIEKMLERQELNSDIITNGDDGDGVLSDKDKILVSVLGMENTMSKIYDAVAMSQNVRDNIKEFIDEGYLKLEKNTFVIN